MAALSLTGKDYAEEDYTCARARMANNCRVQRQDIVEISIENVRVPYLFLLARAIFKDMRRSHCGIFRGWLATDALQPSYVRENDVNLERLRYLVACSGSSWLIAPRVIVVRSCRLRTFWKESLQPPSRSVHARGTRLG